jgi:hypothetical protein
MPDVERLDCLDPALPGRAEALVTAHIATAAR